ncbi:MAG: VOC family protein [Defluviitaleaceae bacterium]|nr:VOC family protein [Defluviitaleaceae bacterium]
MITPCIHFNGNCDEAIKFYKSVLSAEVKEIFYAKDAPPDSGMEGLPPNFVMHSNVLINGLTMGLSDGSEVPVPFGTFSFLIQYETEEEVRSTFGKLEVGGKAEEPLAAVFWSPLYGSVIDKFGVNWQVMKA